ncbi:MAG: sodium:proton antiporter [Bacteroidetes bacterium]|nr:MAG: sodium:proton antiporter [Bacteroidota bacterium]
MFILMVIIFVLGYMAIALEHPLKLDKAASALAIGTLTWAIYALNSVDILNLGFSVNWNELVNGYSLDAEQTKEVANHFVKHELGHHLSEIAEILFFLLGAMTIVETIDQHQGFKLITDKITTKKKVNLLWILSILTFFMSAALDNLTTTIVMVTLLKKLIDDKETRWFFASIIVIAANAGGAWSPIGDVTTIMLWIGGQITAVNVIKMVFLPSLVALVAPLLILTFTQKGNVTTPENDGKTKIFTTSKEQLLFLLVGVGALLFVPVFKTVTHLPPYMGMLLGLSVIWALSEILNRKRDDEATHHLAVSNVLKKVDIPTILFFLGILSAVASLQSAGHLSIVSKWLDNVTGQNIYLIDTAIGLLSSIVDNVPLVAGSMGMYEIAHAGTFGVDGVFWELLAYTAGTGGSILIIGSAAGVAAMGMEKIDFVWYMKKISLLAMVGYFAGIGTYYLQEMVLGADQHVEEIQHVIEVPDHIIDVPAGTHIKLESEMFLKLRKPSESNSEAHAE